MQEMVQIDKIDSNPTLVDEQDKQDVENLEILGYKQELHRGLY